MGQGQKTWFITGASTGFGREMALYVLAQGGRVVATARKAEAVADIVAGSGGRAIGVALDVTKPEQVADAVAKAEAFGGIDVLFNNAGYGFMGGVEESGQDEIAAQMDVNFFGAVDVIRKALPGMRARGSGYIVNVSSITGVKGFVGAGYYSASKFALEGLSEALAADIKPFGLGVMIVEPGPFRTEFAGRSIMQTATPHPDYPHLVKQREFLGQSDGRQAGDPAKAVAAIVNALDAEETPMRLVLGRGAYDLVTTVLKGRLAEVETWCETSRAVDFPDA